MFNNFKRWYTYHQVEITWWLIGWLSLAALHDFSRRDWLGVTIDFALMWVNYKLNK